MDARNRRRCFAERSFSHETALPSKSFSGDDVDNCIERKNNIFVVSDAKPSAPRQQNFRGKLSRTDSSIIVISRCAGNSTPVPPKSNSSKKKFKNLRQNSLSSFFQKHFNHFHQQKPSSDGVDKTPFQKTQTYGNNATNSSNSFAKTSSEKSRDSSVTRANSSRVSQKTHVPLISPLTSPNLLGVPNIFTTAFSRSTRSSPGADVSPEDIRLTEPSDSDVVITKEYSKSTPELQDTPKGGLLSISRRERRPSDDVSQQVTSLLQCNKYKDSHVCEILDYLYMGSIEAAYHEPLLCKLGIDSLIDISNIPAEKVPYHKKSDCPCMCTSRTRHLRAKLYVAVDDDPSENIEQYFEEINSFIEGVRRCGKRVLIYSYHGNSRAPAAVIQHLMTHKNLLLRQSFNLVKNQRPSIKLNPGFRATLEGLEKKLFPAAKPSVSFENEFVNVANPQLVKTAWADC